MTRQELQAVLEDWMLFRISERLDVPEVDGKSLGGMHEVTRRGDYTFPVPNPHHGDISKEFLLRILKAAGISREEWEAL